MMRIQMNEDVYFIIDILTKNGYEAFIVGGCVRDALMGKAPKDWDITTNALPQQIKMLFDHTFDTGIAHGTVTVVLNKENYEVTTYRIDGEYLDCRRPEQVFFTQSITEDLSRRDFTMNAIAYNPDVGFVDPFFGRESIWARTIKCVGQPSKRFLEDGLRLLRCIRFSAVLDFEIEPETHKALFEYAYLIKNISIERIRDEFLKIICAGNTRALTLLLDTEILKFVDEGLFDYFNRYCEEISNRLTQSNTYSKEAYIIALVHFYAFMEDSAHIRDLLKFLRLDNYTVNEVATLCSYEKLPLPKGKPEIKKVLSQIGADTFQRLLSAKKVHNGIERELLETQDAFSEIIQANDCYSIKSLNIKGSDLINAGIKEGRHIGSVLEALLNMVIDEPSLNNREDLLKMALSLTMQQF